MGLRLVLIWGVSVRTVCLETVLSRRAFAFLSGVEGTLDRNGGRPGELGLPRSYPGGRRADRWQPAIQV